MDCTYDKNNKPARLNATLASVHSPVWELEFVSSFALSITAPAAEVVSPSVPSRECIGLPFREITFMWFCAWAQRHVRAIYIRLNIIVNEIILSFLWSYLVGVKQYKILMMVVDMKIQMPLYVKQGSSVSIVTRLWAGRPVASLFATTSWPTYGPT
jgi:hypothetical protein